MAINVTCPGCHKRFKVSEKFAGKEGPCPSCKATIKIPEAGAEVVIHAPEVAGPKDSKGRALLKPIFREETRWSPVAAGAIGGAVLVTLVAALIIPNVVAPAWYILAPGAILLAVPLCYGGYVLMRNMDLEMYEGRELWARVAIVSAIYVFLWGIAWFLGGYLFEIGDSPEYYIPYVVTSLMVMIGLGVAAPRFAFDLDWATAAGHFGLFFVATLLLRMIMGLPAM